MNINMNSHVHVNPQKNKKSVFWSLTLPKNQTWKFHTATNAISKGRIKCNSVHDL